MSRVLTFSRVFPAYHPRKGEPTFFEEKIWCGLADILPQFKIPDHCTDWDWFEYYNGIPKFHTIRAGKQWKVGDKFSPRVWSGKPYQSPQITIAPDIEIKKLWNFDIEKSGYLLNQEHIDLKKLDAIAGNDGLGVDDLELWFAPYAKKEDCHCQIICWNESIEY